MKPKNMKTTIAGILAALAIIFVNVSAAMDEDPNTTIQLDQLIGGIVTALSVMGVGYFAKDATTTVEKKDNVDGPA